MARKDAAPRRRQWPPAHLAGALPAPRLARQQLSPALPRPAPPRPAWPRLAPPCPAPSARPPAQKSSMPALAQKGPAAEEERARLRPERAPPPPHLPRAPQTEPARCTGRPGGRVPPGGRAYCKVPGSRGSERWEVWAGGLLLGVPAGCAHSVCVCGSGWVGGWVGGWGQRSAEGVGTGRCSCPAAILRSGAVHGQARACDLPTHLELGIVGMEAARLLGHRPQAGVQQPHAKLADITGPAQGIGAQHQIIPG